MKSTALHTGLADCYFESLKNLNPDTKLDLISKLSQSLKEESSKTSSETTLQSLFGAYQSEESADEIIADLRTSIVFNRNKESL